MLRFFVAPLLFAGVLASCAPRQQTQTAEQMVTVTPMLVKVSEGGSWLFVEVGGKQSTGLPYSVRQ
jgi:hypothetical protein